MDAEKMKEVAGRAAAEMIESNMRVGIGTGSTVFYFIKHLISRVQDGLHIEAAFSSNRSKEQAEAGGIFSLPNDQIYDLDITVDGADEIDAKKHMIKGGGGALLREKIIATSSKKMLVLVDESKTVKMVGKAKLPVEIAPFAYNAAVKKIEELGYFGTMRRDQAHDLYETDNGNYILDLSLSELVSDVKGLHQKLVSLPGVVETGLFYNIPCHIIVGGRDGKPHIIE